MLVGKNRWFCEMNGASGGGIFAYTAVKSRNGEITTRII